MVTYGVNTLISDSGVIKYRIVAERWEVSDKTRPSKWIFDKGIVLTQFDLKSVSWATSRAIPPTISTSNGVGSYTDMCTYTPKIASTSAVPNSIGTNKTIRYGRTATPASSRLTAKWRATGSRVTNV